MMVLEAVDVASGADRHLDIIFIILDLDCRYRVVESSFLVSVLFREVLAIPYFFFTSKWFLLSLV